MMRARKTRMVEGWLFRYVRRLARGTFHAVWVTGLEQLRGLPPDRPALAVANHSCWWDGFMIHLLTRAAPNRDFYCMMEEKQLRHFPFLTRIGAFSVDLGSPGKAAVALRYAMRMVADPAKLVWVFPQGEMTRAEAPIRVRPGASFMVRKVRGCWVLPVAFRYGFRREQKPEAWIRVGAPVPGEGMDEGRMGAMLEGVRAELWREWEAEGVLGAREVLLRPRWSVNKRWEWVKRACSGRLEDFESGN